jgi:hypothetical protein
MRRAFCILALAVPLVLPSRLLSQKHPEIFDVSDVVLGTHKLDTTYLYAAGAWSDADEIKNALSVHIECFKRIDYCSVAEPVVVGKGPGSVGVSVDGFDILRWDDREMIAADNTPICVVNTIRADFIAKTVTISSGKKATKLADEDPVCKHVDLSTAVLVNHEEVTKKIIEKAKQNKK